ncbi:Butirosin biosynthesis, BtrG-like protein, partial [Ilyonectria robusta]|uniref:Butirosin biosynthesis, BtrG-like protein n=1 Tax=Ilyonectria robusta TaxID=1079257 RepID=UPI001E8CF758
MASEAIGTPAADSRPTKYYFAYGSNLHLRQMKRRCPGSKFIGCARLSHYRWQINERGYANVVEAEGHWVDGLVYEIDEEDEARLDINEGVSKNAYTKRYMTVLLNRAHSPLYRRPTAWIVDKGGPAKVRLLAQNDGQKESEHPQHWEQNVLVYISLNYVVDSKPKDEYIKRINFGVNDAKALGVGDDYVSNCIRPFIPPNQRK